MEKRVVFSHKTLPYLLLAPQLAITVVFFFLPAGQAMWQSFRLEDAFGLSSQFVGWSNFVDLFSNSDYINSFKVTIEFSLLVAISGLVIRSEEHTSELQSLMRISYAVFCLKKKKKKQTHSAYKYI